MLTTRENQILELLKVKKICTSGEIASSFDASTKASLPTIKRDLAKLVSKNLIEVRGKGRATQYAISSAYELLYPIDVTKYYEKEIDERKIRSSFNWDLIRSTLPGVNIFSPQELTLLDSLQKVYTENIYELNAFAYRKELERLAIDLSWKSSQIEGNTYSLLETEHLLKEKETASGKTREEAVMLLNHKDAIDFLIENSDYLNPLSIAGIENIHQILIKDLDVDKNLRTRRVGISGTNYQPPDNAFQIKEAMITTCDLINEKSNIFERALLALALISYIQPFMDGNKRTARIISNAILMAGKYCPISFRTVDSVDYKKAMLIFYEQNNLSNFKDIFISQFEFAVNTYF
jgi:Fic family protein